MVNCCGAEADLRSDVFLSEKQDRVPLPVVLLSLEGSGKSKSNSPVGTQKYLSLCLSV